MDMRKWWPYLVVAGVVVIAGAAFPLYSSWWDHKNCRESGGNWNESAGECIELPNADIPDTRGSAAHEDDNQGGDKPRE